MLNHILAGGLRPRFLSLSQEDLAFRADISAVYVSALERAGYSASIDVIEAIAKALNVTAASLLEATARRSKS